MYTIYVIKMFIFTVIVYICIINQSRSKDKLND